MVRTRNAQAKDDATPEPEGEESVLVDENGQPKPISRALRKLLIDANPALKGERKQEQEKIGGEKETYHWRGAVYEVSPNTPAEWLQDQPSRHKKRKHDEMYSRGTPEEEDTDAEQPKRKRGRPRKIRDISGESEPQRHIRSRLVQSPESSPRKRGRPSRQHMLDRLHAEPGTTTSSRHTRSQGILQSTPSTRSSRKHHPTPQEIAEQRGINVQPISQADMLTGSIAINITKFCAVQAQLRKIEEQYKQAYDLRTRIHALDEEEQTIDEEEQTAETDESTSEFEDVIYSDPLKPVEPMTPDVEVVEAPMTPDAEVVGEPMTPDAEVVGEPTTPDAEVVGESMTPDAEVVGEPMTPDAEVVGESMTPDAEVVKDQLPALNQVESCDYPNASKATVPQVMSTSPLDNHIEVIAPTKRQHGFGPWDPLPRQDGRGNVLQWSLRTAKDLDGRAEYHIYTGKLHDREHEEQRDERIRRELAIVEDWEESVGGRVIIHDPQQDRAHVPRRDEYYAVGGAENEPRRLPIDTPFELSVSP